jgi:SNF2 family DNA or RNA helicase
MLGLNNFHEYQHKGLNHSLQHPESMLWLDMGLGKTAVSLATIIERMDRMEVYGTLILGPLRPIQTVWEQEAEKWHFSKDLTFSFIHGSESDKVRAISMKSDVYLINYEGLEWLAEYLIREYLSQGKYLPFNMIVADEVSKFKNVTTNRHKAYRKFCMYAPYRMGLTGTPCGNGLKNLFGQFLAIDGGKRLGVSEKAFKDTYFNKVGYMGYDLEEKPETETAIMQRVSDITLQMSASDYLDLPPVVFNNIAVPLTPKLTAQYDKLESELFVQLDNTQDAIEAVNMAALSVKLRQFTGGSSFTDPDNPVWAKIHDLKLDALDDVIEESAGAPVLCFYQFTHERDRILKKYKNAEFFKSGMSVDTINDIIRRWNNNEIPLLVAHCQSAGHGLNLQYAKHASIVWYGLTWSLENYLQAIARIARQGVEQVVVVHRLLCPNTIDEAIALSLKHKATTENDMRNAVAEYRKNKYGD